MEKTLEKLISNNNRGLFLLDPPTGFGKTAAVVNLIKRFLKGEPCFSGVGRKVRSTHRLRGNAGEPLSQPPYGYMKSPDNKKKWIIDEEAARVVRQIFQWCIEGICLPQHNKRKRAEILLQTKKYRQKNIECSSLSL